MMMGLKRLEGDYVGMKRGILGERVHKSLGITMKG